MRRLSIHYLGSFQVYLNGQGITASFRTDKERALLAYLALESHQSHRREALAELFWPERPEGYARTNLRQAVYGLRRTLGDRTAEAPFLLVDDESVQLNPQMEIHLDVREFNNLLKGTQSHPHRSLETCQSCATELQTAVDLYRGDFLSEFYAADSHAYLEWIVFHREQYFRKLLASLQSLSQYHQQAKNYEEVYKYAWQHVSLAPLEEQAHRQLMLHLAINGRRTAAIEQYHTCRRILADELGVEPSQETTSLYERIKAGVALEVGPPVVKSPHNNLPAPFTQFVGRESELAWFSKCLPNQVCRLLTLVGMAGVGKSRLAIKAARQYIDSFPDGVWYVNLENTCSVDEMLTSMAQALALPFDSVFDVKSQILHTIQPLNALFILDGLDQVDIQTDFLMEILRRSPGVKLLVTSQMRLNIQAACTLELRGLEYPMNAQDPNAWEYPAVQMFLARVTRSISENEITKRYLPLISQICQKVDGLPLGIELAAASLRTSSLDKLAQELPGNLSLLSTSMQDIAERHRSIRSAFDQSWSRLNPVEHQVFRNISQIPGEFTIDDMDRVGRPSAATLTGLVDRSMLEVDAGGRYKMHPLFKSYGLEKLGHDTGELSLESIDKREQSQALATHDPLTNLPNWLLFRDRLAHTLSRSRRSNSPVAIFLLDLEDLEALKERSGRANRDRALQIIAERLVRELRVSDTVARVAPARFGLILEDVSGVKGCVTVAVKLLATLSLAVNLDGESYFVNGRLGINRFPEDSEDLDTLLKNAQQQIEQARQQGKKYICPPEPLTKQPLGSSKEIHKDHPH
jgi:diguanylate cyclase (GGDEF)-like protein